MKKLRLTPLVRHILKTAAGGGEYVLAATAPNALRVQNISSLSRRQTRNKNYYSQKIVDQLIHRGFIKKTKHFGTYHLELTSLGEQQLDRFEIGTLAIQKPKHWNGQYHVIIFDIKEKRRKIRDEIRIWLQELGFVRLQQSVWVSPYECQAIITLLKTRSGVGKELLYLIVNSIENDHWLRKYFGLS